MIRKIIIQEVIEWKSGTSEKTGKPWDLAILQGADGLRYSCFDRQFVESFKLGEEVECEVEEKQNGKYINRTIKKPTGANLEANKSHQEVMNGLRKLYEKMEEMHEDIYKLQKNEEIKPKEEGK